MGFNVSFQLINGMMLGIEFPTLTYLEEGNDEPQETLAIQIDLLVLRIMLVR